MRDRAKTEHKQERSAATQRALIELGLERFVTSGYSSTSVEGLVAASGLTRGAFYFHFANKEEFFLALLAERARRRGEWWLIGAETTAGTLSDAVLGVLEHFGRADPHGSDWALITADFLQNWAEPEHRTQVTAFYQRWIDELAQFLDLLAARDLIRRDLPTGELAAEVFGAIQGISIHARLYGTDPMIAIDVVNRILRP